MMTQFKPFSLNIGGRLFEARRPQVMGIVNVTPDSFFAASRTADRDMVLRRTEQLIADGADMIDIGAYSSRPGADIVSPDEEKRRLAEGLEALRKVSGTMPISVDTFRADVAREAVTNLGADIINDISGGLLDTAMLDTVAELHVPYILMHMRGNPQTMQSLTGYADVTADVCSELSATVTALRERGVADIIIDPGFGFSKTLEQNYRLLASLSDMARLFGLPLLVGAPRKSMLTKALEIGPEDALNATTVVNTIALMQGASILRVHDARPAAEAVRLVELTFNPSN